MPTSSPTGKTPSVLIVDDHPIVVDGVRALLGERFRIVGSAHDGRAAITQARESRPDLVVLDVRLPDLSAGEIVRGIRDMCPTTSILLFTAHASSLAAMDALTAGADASLPKDAGSTHLVQALQALAAGRPPQPPAVIRSSVGIRPLGVELTPRQREILRHVAAGETNREIAEALGLTPNTVKSYWQQVLQKLGARNRVEALLLAQDLLVH
ncbi:response regulator [Streptomyces sp. NPDC001663]|uniref:response regulator n=1 Tax=Streptomyces sp. NPDC001663 TaxID=3364597 RepID=UPI0036AA29F9